MTKLLMTFLAGAAFAAGLRALYDRRGGCDCPKCAGARLLDGAPLREVRAALDGRYGDMGTDPLTLH